MIASLTQRFPTPAWQLALSVRSRFSLNTTSMSTPVLAQSLLLQETRRAAPFFGLNGRMPIILALVLGFNTRFPCWPESSPRQCLVYSIDVFDCMRHAVQHPNHSLPHVRIPILYWS